MLDVSDARRPVRRLAAVVVAMGVSATSARALEVRLVRPAAGDVVFGPVTIAAELEGAASKLVFVVDGKECGARTEPPWEVSTDVGPDNREHHVLVIATGSSGATARASLTTAKLHVDGEVSVELRQLYVTAREGDRRIGDLGRADFAVSDEGRPQSLVTFARGDIPFTATLLVDASDSMRAGKLASAIDGARVFIAGMRPLDEAALLAFSDHIRHLSPFTGPEGAEAEALREIAAQGGTSVNDHLYLALKLLEQRNGRRTIVLLSDGVDVNSALTMAEVRRALRRSQVLLYWIRISATGRPPVKSAASIDFTSVWRTSDEHRREIDELEEAVEESGGRVVDVSPAADLGAAFRDVLEELRDQYVLGYYPTHPRRDGSWRRVDVNVNRPGIRIRPCGYLDL